MSVISRPIAVHYLNERLGILRCPVTEVTSANRRIVTRVTRARRHRNREVLRRMKMRTVRTYLEKMSKAKASHPLV